MNSPFPNIDVAKLKRLAEGRWADILVQFGFAPDILDGRHYPCPKCAGLDRFRYLDQQVGACLCNQCFHKKNGDGIAAIGWLNGWDFPQTVQRIARFLGLTATDVADEDVVARIARLKRIPLPSWQAYGARQDEREGFLVCRVPMYDVNRQRCSYQDYSDRSPRFLKGMSAKGLPSGLFVVDDEWPEPGDIVYLVEGCKDAAALRDCLIRNHLHGKVIGLSTSKMAEKYSTLFRNCEVTLVPDLDTAGEAGSNQTAARLRGIARCVRVARIPGELNQTDGDGVREVLAGAGGEQRLLTSLREARIWTPEWVQGAVGTRNSKPHVFCTLDEKYTNDQIIRVLRSDDTIFQRGGSLVRVIHEAAVAPGIKRSPTAPSIQPLPEASVREAISKNVILQERRGDEIVDIRVPNHVSRAIHQRGEWAGIRKLESVVTFPVLRADGSVATEPGFDVRTGLYLDVAPGLVVLPENPSLVDAQAGLKKLCEVVSDFPFEKTPHRSAWLAYLLTPLARFAFNGPAPLFMVDANTRGSGKTLLSEIGAQIVTGTDFARLAPCREDDEMRKRITAIALRGDPLVLLDNVVGDLGSSALDSALTSTAWSDRLLGQSQQLTIPLYATWVATGNNIILAADTTRRVCHIRLSSPEERPEERTDFLHPDILSYVRSNRRTLLSAALTILVAYFKAGRPPQSMRPWGSYEDWSSIVRSAIVWLGESDPAETREELALISDQGANVLSDLIAGWELANPDGSGMTVSQAIQKMEDQYGPEQLKQAIRGVCGLPAGKVPTAVSLGKHMKKHRRRVIGRKCLDCATNGDGVMVWRVVSDGGYGG